MRIIVSPELIERARTTSQVFTDERRSKFCGKEKWDHTFFHRVGAWYEQS